MGCSRMCSATHPPCSRMRRWCPILLGLSSPSSGTRLLAEPPHSGVAGAVTRACPRGWTELEGELRADLLPQPGCPQQVHRECAEEASQDHPTSSPHFGILAEGRWSCPCHSLTQICWDMVVLSAGTPDLGGAALCHSHPPSDTDPTPIPIPQQPARGKIPANPFPPSGQCPARSRGPPGPC